LQGLFKLEPGQFSSSPVQTFHEIAAIYAFGQLKESPLIQFCPIHLWVCGLAILLGSLVPSQMV